MLEKLLGPDIHELIAEHDEATLAEVLDGWLPADVAALLVELSDEDELPAFRALKGPQQVQVFEHFDEKMQMRLVEHLPPEEAGHILNEMAPDDRTGLLEEADPEQSAKWFALMNQEQQAIARGLLNYPEESVGRLMTPDFVAVRDHWTIQHVLDYVRRHGKDSETLNVLYVVDAEHRLIDDIRIRRILLAAPRKTVRDLMDGNLVSLKGSDDKRSAVSLFRQYDRTALPVVDDHGRLQGIVTIDDVLDIAEEAATEDIHGLGGLEALDEPYSDTPLMVMVQKRASWLVLLFLGEMLTATAMGYYEDELKKGVVLMMFVPLIISSGGNSGSQASSLIVRALALTEVRLRDWRTVFKRELFSGLMLGLILGSIGFLRIAVWSVLFNPYGEHWALIGLTVAVSLIGVVLWGTLSGAMLPFILKRVGFDPAKSSAPFVATLVDVTGLVIYFSTAMLILRGTVLPP